MAEYWTNRAQYELPDPPAPPSSPSDSDRQLEDSFLSEYDRHRLLLVTKGVDEEWQLELRRYLQDMSSDVTRDTDIIIWWSVSHIAFIFSHPMIYLVVESC
jgi:hypothetical protein